MLNVIFRETFKNDYLEIYQYISEYFGEMYTPNFVVQVDKKVFTLSVFPNTGRATSDTNVFEVVCGKNKIFYSFTEKDLILRRIIDTRRAVELLKELNG